MRLLQVESYQPLLMYLMISLFCSPLANVYCSAQEKGQMMVKRDLAESGFSIILPSESSFDAELMKLGLNQSAEARELKPFSVILKNSSTRSIVAFALRWTVVDATGNVTTHDRSYIQPSGLLDGGRARRERTGIEHQIRPGAFRLITVNGMARSAEELHDLAAGSFVGSVKDVVLDLAIFDDGEAVGANELGLMERFAAFVNAEQDLMQEVDSRISKGEALKPILEDIRNRLAPDSGEVPVTPAAIYDHNFRIYLNELEITTKNAGEEATKRIVTHRKYDVRPNIRKRMNSPNPEVK